MQKMEETTLSTIIPSVSPASPCTSNEAIARTEDGAMEGAVQRWLENEAFPGFRVWQLAGIVLSILLSIVIGLCCCIRFRVPRTKQEIEADYIRKRITRSFRRELSKISNTEMDQMDLQKALDRIRGEFEEDTVGISKECANISQRSAQRCFRSRFNAVFGGMRVRFSQPREHGGELSAMI